MPKQRQILYLCAGLIDLGAAGIFFAVSRRAAELGATGSQLGALGALWAGVYSITVFLTGRLSDRIGRRCLAVTGLGVTSIFIVACGFTTNIPLVLALMVGYGISTATVWPTIMGWLGENVMNSGELNARLGKFSIAWTVGFVVGSGLSGTIFRFWPNGVFLIAALPVLLAASLLCIPARADTDSAGATVQANLPPVPKGRGFRKTAWLANFASTLTTQGVCALFPQLATHLDIRADIHGGMLALFRAASLIAFFGLARWQYWRTHLWPMWIAQFIAALALALIGSASQTWLFAVAFTVAGIVAGYTYQASIFFTLEEVTGKGEGSGLHEAVLGIGIFLGPLLAGWVGDQYSIRSPYYFCAGMLALLVVVQMLLVFFRRRTPSGEISVNG